MPKCIPKTFPSFSLMCVCVCVSPFLFCFFQLCLIPFFWLMFFFTNKMMTFLSPWQNFRICLLTFVEVSVAFQPYLMFKQICCEVIQKSHQKVKHIICDQFLNTFLMLKKILVDHSRNTGLAIISNGCRFDSYMATFVIF